MPEFISPEEFDKELQGTGGKADLGTLQEIYKLNLEAYSLKNIDYAQNIEQRKQYADLIFSLVCIWLSVVLVILVSCGRGTLHLSDTVLSILLGTTTANVCGFLLFVVKYLFNVEGAKVDSPGLSKKKKAKKTKS